MFVLYMYILRSIYTLLFSLLFFWKRTTLPCQGQLSALLSEFYRLTFAIFDDVATLNPCTSMTSHYDSSL